MGLRRTRAALLALTLVACTLAACGSAGSATGTTASSTSSTTTTAPISFADDATVTVAVSHLPANFNPWSPAGSDAVAAEVMAQVWPQVSVLDRNLTTQICTTISPVCPSELLVSAEPVSLNPLTVVYRIAPNASWSDGVPITGADFEYLREEVDAEAGQLPAIDPVAGYEDIKSLSSPGNGKTVTVVFDRPYADWQSLFTNIVPAHVATISGFTQSFTGSTVSNLVSGGPYEITKIIPGREVILGRNPSFWGPRPHIARIIFRVEATEAAALAALEQGKVTVAQFTPGATVDAVVGASTTLYATTTFSPVLWQLAFNLADPLTATLAVREAIAKALDRHQLLSDTLGLLTPTSFTVGNRIFGAGTNGGDGNDSGYALVDVDEAEELLKSAGYHYSADGIARDASGAPLVVTLTGPVGRPVVSSVEAEIQAELLQVGIEVRIVEEPLATLLGKTLPTGDYTMAIAPYDVTPYLSTTARLYTDPVLQTPFASAPGSVVSGAVSRDVLGLSDAKIGPLFLQAETELDPGSLDDAYNEIDTALWLDLPTVPLFEMPVTTVWHNSLQGLSPAESWTNFLYDAQNWNWELNAPPTVTTTTTTTTTTVPPKKG